MGLPRRPRMPRELEVPLFERQTNRFAFPPTGEFSVEYAKKVLSQVRASALPSFTSDMALPEIAPPKLYQNQLWGACGFHGIAQTGPEDDETAIQAVSSTSLPELPEPAAVMGSAVCQTAGKLTAPSGRVYHRFCGENRTGRPDTRTERHGGAARSGDRLRVKGQ